MKQVIEFITTTDISKIAIFEQLKCSKDEANILQHITKQYSIGSDSSSVIDVLGEFYDIAELEHLEHIDKIKNLLEFGWIVGSDINHIKVNEISNLELLNSNIALSVSFLKLLENGNLDFAMPEIKEYNDHLEYLQDQFLRIDLAQKLSSVKHNFDENSPNINRLKSKLKLVETSITKRVEATKTPIALIDFFKEYELNIQEQMIFLILLKEEYSGGEEATRDMNSLIDIISNDDYEKIKNRSLLEDNSKLISNNLINYDEMLTMFGGINRSFFIPEDILYKISHPNANNKTKKQKIKLDMLIKEQELFELIEPKKSLEDVVLNPKTREVLNSLLKQVDKNVINRLKEWGIKDKKRGIEAKIIFYGFAGTGKTMTSLALAKSLKKQVLSFDCSKILSMYVGESEKNVRNIFDTYKDLCTKSKSEPILLLNEADQFLSSRTTSSTSGTEKMHNQMQNIFLEQIERFDGILIATTNLLESIDTAFSRRFNYKIEFKKPTLEQRIELWQKLLPNNLPNRQNLDIDKLAKYDLTGGQIELVIKNTAYKIAIKDEPIFSDDDFIEAIKKEKSGNFDSQKQVGFI